MTKGSDTPERMSAGTMTARQVADFLQLHPDTVKAMAGSGELPGVQIGREWRFLRADVLALFPPPGSTK